MPKESSRFLRGYIQDFSVSKSPSTGTVDVSIVLASDWEGASDRTAVRFSQARRVRFGEYDGIGMGSYFCLAIEAISANGWEELKFEVHEVDDNTQFSLYCSSIEVEPLGVVEATDAVR